MKIMMVGFALFIYFGCMGCIIWLMFYLHEYGTNKVLKLFEVEKKDANKYGAALACAMYDKGVLPEYHNKSSKERNAWACDNKEAVVERLKNPSYLQTLAW